MNKSKAPIALGSMLSALITLEALSKSHSIPEEEAKEYYKENFGSIVETFYKGDFNKFIQGINQYQVTHNDQFFTFILTKWLKIHNEFLPEFQINGFDISRQ